MVIPQKREDKSQRAQVVEFYGKKVKISLAKKWLRTTRFAETRGTMMRKKSEENWKVKAFACSLSKISDELSHLIENTLVL